MAPWTKATPSGKQDPFSEAIDNANADAVEKAFKHMDDDMHSLASRLKDTIGSADKIDVAALRDQVSQLQLELKEVFRMRRFAVKLYNDKLIQQRVETETLRKNLAATTDKNRKLADDKKALKKDKDELEQKHSNPAANGVAEAQCEYLQKALGLTSENMTKLEATNKEMSEKHAAEIQILKTTLHKYKTALEDVHSKYTSKTAALQALEEEARTAETKASNLERDLKQSRAKEDTMRKRVKKYEDHLDSTQASITHILKVRGPELEQAR